MQDRVQVGDLPEAVAAALQGCRHEAEAPLADIEGGPPVMVRRGIPVGHHHLGQRQPVRDRPDPAAVVVSDLVQDHALAVVEADPQRPVLPAERIPGPGEGGPFRLTDLQWPHIRAETLTRNEPGNVLAHRQRRIDPVGVPELEQFHPVQVHQRVQAIDRVGVRVAAIGAPAPDVHPAHPALAMLLRHERVAVGPGVEEHQVQVGDPAVGQRGDHPAVPAQHRVRLMPLVQRRVRLHPGPGVERAHRVVGQRDDRHVHLAVRAVPAHHPGVPADLVAAAARRRARPSPVPAARSTRTARSRQRPGPAAGSRRPAGTRRPTAGQADAGLAAALASRAAR